jgi:hypothetical protein
MLGKWNGNLKTRTIKNMSDIAQHKEEKSKGIPDEFIVNSKIVFISNFEEIPEEIGEDVLAIQLNYDKEKSIALIETQLDQYLPEYPELTVEDKKEVIDFMRRNQSKAKMTFQTFLHICTIKKSGSPNWEKWATQQFENEL